METNKIYQGHALDILKTFPDHSIDMCVTSPPYYGLRKYGGDEFAPIWNDDKTCEHEWLTYVIRGARGGDGSGKLQTKGTNNFQTFDDSSVLECSKCGAMKCELGQEPTPLIYIDHLVEIFREVRRVLKTYGTLWINIGDSYAGCYDDETEILTEDGFVLFKDLKHNQKVATLVNGELKYIIPDEYHVYDWDGKMYEIDRKSVNLCVTPDHNLYIKEYHHNNYSLIPIKDVTYKTVHLINTCNWNGKEQEWFYMHSVLPIWCKNVDRIKMDDFLEFYGYFLSDGCTIHTHQNKNGEKSYRVKISQINGSKKDKIRKCLDRLPYPYYETDTYFEFGNKQMWTYLSLFGKSYDKYIDKQFKNLSSRQLKILYDALMLGDGSRNTYFTVSRRLVDDVQELLLKIGKSSTVSTRKPRQTIIKDRIINSKNIQYEIHRRDRKRLNLKNFSDEINIINYTGKVYCVTVPSHIIYVRRKGKSMWCGNSGGKGSQYSKDVPQYKQHKVDITRTSLMCIPQRLMIALVDDGWVCRNDIIWEKNNGFPHPDKTKCTPNHEHIYELGYMPWFATEPSTYHYKQLTEPLIHDNIKHDIAFGGTKADGYGNAAYSGRIYKPNSLKVKNARDTWHIWKFPTANYSGPHFAVYPVELPRRAIEAGCPKEICSKCGTPVVYDLIPVEDGISNYKGKGVKEYEENGVQNASDVKRRVEKSMVEKEWIRIECDCNAEFIPGIVLDPFMGSGTTAEAALTEDVNYIGIELFKENIELSDNRIRNFRPMMNSDSLWEV